MSELLQKCSRRGCGWIGTQSQMRQRKEDPRKHHGLGCTTLVCPRCGCESFYKAKPHEKASDSVLPASIANAKFVMICTGDGYHTKIVDGAKLHEEWAIATCGKLEDCPDDDLAYIIESMKDMENWRMNDSTPVCWEEDVGETDHIAFWRLE